MLPPGQMDSVRPSTKPLGIEWRMILFDWSQIFTPKLFYLQIWIKDSLLSFLKNQILLLPKTIDRLASAMLFTKS
jgi:hypothetical protein